MTKETHLFPRHKPENVFSALGAGDNFGAVARVFDASNFGSVALQSGRSGGGAFWGSGLDRANENA